MNSLRSLDTEARYNEVKKRLDPNACPICDREPIKKFKFWKIIPNQYPYDRIAKVHNMIVPIRHVKEEEISHEEWQEYQEIKNNHLHKEYDYVIEATYKMKSIPSHFHLHIIVIIKDEYESYR